MKLQEFKDFAYTCRLAGIKTLGDYRAYIKNNEYPEQPIYINGELATKGAIAEFENCLRLGIERAKAKCVNGCIYYTTM